MTEEETRLRNVFVVHRRLDPEGWKGNVDFSPVLCALGAKAEVQMALDRTLKA